jgi:methionine synthase II (cobalamin-independent)
MADKLHRNPPFRAEHLGSLLRPEELLNKRHEVEEGKLTDADLKPYEDKAVDGIVKEQLELGYKCLTDGEYRRHSMSLAHSHCQTTACL